MNYKIITIALATMLVHTAIQAQYSWNKLPVVQQPVFKKDSFDIRKYGAVAGGVQLVTKAINQAIAECSRKGGGVVVVPPGLWLTGPVELKNNVNLHLKTAALLLFTKDKDQYPLVAGHYEGRATARNQSPISATGQQNIAITGTGVIDGHGDVWRAVGKGQMNAYEWKEKIASGGVLSKDGNEWYPSEQFKQAKEGNANMLLSEGSSLEAFKTIKDFLRPNLLVLTNCKKVLLEGVVFQNSPAWNLHLLLCEDLTLRKVMVKNPAYAQNGDGMDIESCKNFLIEGCTLDVGDDAICIKSGKDEEGRKRGKPSENGVVRNNIVYKGHGGFVVGSEMSGGVRNIFIENCTFMGTDKGLRFKSTRGRGGVVEKIYARNIVMNDIRQEAIFFDMYYFVKFATDGERDTQPVLNEGTPVFRDMEFTGIQCDGAEKAIFIRGLPEMAVRGIRISDASFKTRRGVELTDAGGIQLDHIRFELPITQPLITGTNVDGLITAGISYPAGIETFLSLKGEHSKNIKVSSERKTSEKVETSAEVPGNAVQIN